MPIKRKNPKPGINLLSTLAFVSLTLCSLPVFADDTLALEAQTLAQTFSAQLKPRLLSAMQSGGPAIAIQVCSKEAPKIAEQLSADSGWLIKRVSLNPRNRPTATADEWETKVLEGFEQQRHSAVNRPAITEPLVYAETIAGRYRYMQAQTVTGVCLHCHGTSLSSEVVRALLEVYPDDIATGYKLGDVRGAISLVREVVLEGF